MVLPEPAQGFPRSRGQCKFVLIVHESYPWKLLAGSEPSSACVFTTNRRHRCSQRKCGGRLCLPLGSPRKELKLDFMPTAFPTDDWQPGIETKSLFFFFCKKIQLAIEHGASPGNSYILIITLLQVVKIHASLQLALG